MSWIQPFRAGPHIQNIRSLSNIKGLVKYMFGKFDLLNLVKAQFAINEGSSENVKH